MRKSTMVELVDELKKLPPSEGVNIMIDEALAGEYHDFKSKKYVCGKLESSQRLRKMGHNELAERIEEGEFDEDMDEDDRELMRQDIERYNTDSRTRDTLKSILNLDDK